MYLALKFENVCQPIPSAASPLAAQAMSGEPGVDGGATGGEMGGGGASVQESAWSGMGGAPLAVQDKFAGDGTGRLHYTQGLVGDVNTPGHTDMALSTYPPVVQHAHAQELCYRV
jgi:hypothetical protein